MHARSRGVILALAALSLTGAAAAAPRCRIERYPPMAVTMRDLRPLIWAKIDGVRARFLVDTGAFFSMLSPSGAARFKLSYQYVLPGTFLSGANGLTRPELATADTFTFLQQKLRGVQFLVGGNDLQAGVIGVIGENLLRVADVEYDFANGVMRFIRPVHCGDMPLAYWAHGQPVAVVDLDHETPRHPQLVGSAVIDGHRIRVIFDTGASRSILTLSAARRVGIGPGEPGVVHAGRIGGVGHWLDKSWIAPVALLQIGGEKIKHTRIMVGNIHLGEDADMVIGSDFFLAHHVYVANSQDKLYFTYSGGPVFALGQRPGAPAAAGLASPHPAPAAASRSTGAHSAPAGSTPAANAAELVRRAMAAASRTQYSLALKELDRACALDPTNASCFFQRGRTYLLNGQPRPALADLDTALRLRPDDYQAYLWRAQVRFALRRKADTKKWVALTAAAVADLNAAARLLRPDAQAHLGLAQLYDRAGAFAPALSEARTWMRHHPSDQWLPFAWEARCWARASAGRHLHRALRDCNRALDIMPGATGALDGCGLVYLRLGQLRRAIRNYDAALRNQPSHPLPRYGRGLAELRLGERAKGRADLAAARKIDPDTARRYAQMGLRP